MNDFDDPDPESTGSTAVIETSERPRQQVSVPHLVMGLVFLGIAGSWALHAAGVIGSVDVQWLLPLVLVVAGAAGLLASLTRNLGSGRS
jgi:hypothetical protein